MNFSQEINVGGIMRPRLMDKSRRKYKTVNLPRCYIVALFRKKCVSRNTDVKKTKISRVLMVADK